ncbi:hypothetical protein IQ782_27730 [Salipiger pacificus]|uniref:Uncharacterized protein n=2 Tax=Salipiger mangrovisoli TaxID=2865933 RepID=A0ABR9XAV6_9RHOB|nr:hypothetical protein [Salipiger mangrovisoli]
MLGSTAAGASAAGTTGIIAGSAGVGAAITSVLMAPFTIVAGALTVVVVGGYEGVCYFQIERVEEPSDVLAILESISKNDPSIEIVDIEAGRAIQLDREGGEESYLIENLYIADGDLMHRDRFLNTNLGPVVFVEPSAEPD